MDLLRVKLSAGTALEAEAEGTEAEGPEAE